MASKRKVNSSASKEDSRNEAEVSGPVKKTKLPLSQENPMELRREDAVYDYDGGAEEGCTPTPRLTSDNKLKTGSHGGSSKAGSVSLFPTDVRSKREGRLNAEFTDFKNDMKAAIAKINGTDFPSGSSRLEALTEALEGYGTSAERVSIKIRKRHYITCESDGIDDNIEEPSFEILMENARLEDIVNVSDSLWRLTWEIGDDWLLDTYFRVWFLPRISSLEWKDNGSKTDYGYDSGEWEDDESPDSSETSQEKYYDPKSEAD